MYNKVMTCLLTASLSLLEVVQQDAAARPLWKADAIPPFVVQVVLVDGQQRQVRLAR